MANLNRDLLHGTVHHPAKFYADTEILKGLEGERRFGRTDGRMDRQTDGRAAGRNDRRQYPSAPMAAEGNKSTGKATLKLSSIEVVASLCNIRQSFTTRRWLNVPTAAPQEP